MAAVPLDDASLDELLGAYALDAVDADERAQIDRYLGRSAMARREVAEHLEVAALLGSAVGEPPPAGAWERLAGRLEAPPAPPAVVAPLAAVSARSANRPSSGRTGPAPSVTVRGPRSASRARRWGTGVVAAAAASVIAVLGATVVHQEDRIDDLARAASATRPTGVEVERLLSRPSTKLATLSSTDRAVVVRIVLGDDGIGWVLGEQLPPLPVGRTYQLWGVSGDRVLSLGVLGPHPSTIPFSADGTAGPATAGTTGSRRAVWSAFAITAEDGPGVVTSREQAVVTGTLA